MKQALYWKKLKNKIVQCQLCPHFCVIKENEIGKCRVRKNINGILYSLSYGKPISINLDPITKKPLYHYLPNTFTFSIGMAGCNLGCEYCQNWELSQKNAEEFKASETKVSDSAQKSRKISDIKEISPKELVKQALKSGCPSISYTYSEPLTSYEYVFDIAKLAKKAGLKNILVTNGFINKEPFDKIAPYIDAANIDLKSFSESFYNKLCKAKLQPVLDTIKRFHQAGIHIELTTLLIPGENDSKQELTKIAKFISKIDKNIPWHISRFFPMYKMLDKPVTPIESLKLAEEIGKKAGLKFVHIGNV